MNITLRPKTQKLLEERMKKDGASDPEAVVRMALETLEQVEVEPLENLDEDTQAAIARAEAQSAQGEGRPWAVVKKELRERFVTNNHRGRESISTLIPMKPQPNAPGRYRSKPEPRPK